MFVLKDGVDYQRNFAVDFLRVFLVEVFGDRIGGSARRLCFLVC